uniref:Histone-lysine N-methyltransferase ATX5-like n=1 Tax=Rhizophora mucronata TaxID=61149 RepID=A0A2P2JFL4_RHIMU
MHMLFLLNQSDLLLKRGSRNCSLFYKKNMNQFLLSGRQNAVLYVDG